MDHDRIESYIYHRLGLDRNEDMASDNAHDRVSGAWQSYEDGRLEVPGDWKTPQSWHDAVDASKGYPTYDGSSRPSGGGKGWSALGLLGKLMAVLLVGLIVLVAVSIVSGVIEGLSGR